MARARLLKPGFFKNEDLGELGFEDRLLFAGLWTLSDREGRLVDRPRRIKTDIFPYDLDVDVDAGLDRLSQRAFILRYEVNNEHFIQIVNFDKHQQPHVREPESTIPAPVEHGANQVQEQFEHASGPAVTETVTVTEAETVTETVGGAPADAAPAVVEPGAKQKRERRRSIAEAESEIPSLQDDHPTVNVAAEFQLCVSYWKSKGRDHHDWVQALRNWILKEEKYARQRAPATGRASPRNSLDYANAGEAFASRL